MEPVWIQSVHNLHCPECDRRLVERGARVRLLDREAPAYVGEVGTLLCRDGHPLPDRSTLYDYRDQRGHPRHAPVREVRGPR